MREADSGKSIIEVCRERNISEVTFHRWKREFGMIEVNEAKRLKELERENSELKKMLADSLLKNRGLEAINPKNGGPGEQAPDGPPRRQRWPARRPRPARLAQAAARAFRTVIKRSDRRFKEIQVLAAAYG